MDSLSNDRARENCDFSKLEDMFSRIVRPLNEALTSPLEHMHLDDDEYVEQPNVEKRLSQNDYRRLRELYSHYQYGENQKPKGRVR
jgi:hypothetical protein